MVSSFDDDQDDFLASLEAELNKRPRTRTLKCGIGFHEVEVPLTWKLKAWCPDCYVKTRDKYLREHGIDPDKHPYTGKYG